MTKSFSSSSLMLTKLAFIAWHNCNAVWKSDGALQT